MQPSPDSNLLKYMIVGFYITSLKSSSVVFWRTFHYGCLATALLPVQLSDAELCRRPATLLMMPTKLNLSEEKPYVKTERDRNTEARNRIMMSGAGAL